MSDIEMFQGVEVTIYKIDGQKYLTAEDLGRCLGLGDPRKSVNKIYHRHRDELQPHTAVAKMSTPSGFQSTRLFNEIGCYLISFFAKTPKAQAQTEDLGRCLSLAEPRKAVNKIYYRHQQELEPHACIIKLMTQGGTNLVPPGGAQETRLFNEIGCYLIGIFSRSTAKMDANGRINSTFC